MRAPDPPDTGAAVPCGRRYDATAGPCHVKIVAGALPLATLLRLNPTLFLQMKVSELIVSLVDPDGFIAALGG
jgi:hypothetical protein